MREIYAADFETNTSIEGCKSNPVWAWGLQHIYKTDKTYNYGNSIDSFFARLKQMKNNSVVYFHNEKFDGQFILYYILKNGWKRSNNKNLENSFDDTIDNKLKFYDITLRFRNTRNKMIEVHIRDSLKKIAMPIAAMPKAYGLDIEKGNLDDKEEEGYNIYRARGHELTEFEQNYLKRDVEILAKTLKIVYDEGLTEMTMAMDAMTKYKSMLGKEVFDFYYPVISIEEDAFIRKAYKGGWTYCLKEQRTLAGRVYDVNSLYSSVLYSKTCGVTHAYPTGYGVYYQGDYPKDKNYPLYVAHFSCGFRCKKDKLPFIQLKPDFSSKRPVYEYESDGIVELYLTSVDLELFFETYDVYTDIDWIDGYMYRAVSGLFDEYIDYWLNVKVQAKKDGNRALYTIAKIYLNSLYGKFGTSKSVSAKRPTYNKNKDVVEYVDEVYTDEKGNEYNDYYRDAYYVPVAAFCTAYARGVTLRVADEAYKQGRFCYADPDSVHIIGDYPLDNILVDSNNLGWWDHESSFEKAIFLRAKTYAEFDGKEWDIKCAGMPDPVKNALKTRSDFEDLFKVGFATHKTDKRGVYLKDKNDEYIRIDESIPGRKTPLICSGGTILKERPFRITEK